MKEFIEKLIKRLEELKELHAELIKDGLEEDYHSGCEGMCVDIIKIVNQLAKEHEHCIKSSCTNCEVYDKEKHYCPKWCEVIKHTTSELAEEYENDFCEWKYDGTMYDRCPHTETLFARIHNCDEKIFKFCPYCGKEIKVVEPKGE